MNQRHIHVLDYLFLYLITNFQTIMSLKRTNLWKQTKTPIYKTNTYDTRHKCITTPNDV